jgi:VWFA-related protein
MTEGDKVAIVGHDVRLKVYSDFTSDKKKLRRALDDVARFSLGLTKPSGSDPSILKTVDPSAMMNRTGTVYEALTELADALKPIRARKNLVVFSAGIYEPGEEVRNGLALNRSRYYQPMIDALNAANVTVYAMNLMPDAPAAPVFHQTLESISRETNGDYYRYAVTFKPSLDQVARASAGYYLLTYRTQKRGHGFQKVAVSVKNHPEFRVAARAGYSYGD